MFQIAKNVNSVNNANNVNNVNIVNNVKNVYSVNNVKHFLRPQIIFEIPKRPWDLKPLDLDTLEIAQLAHHLRPFFGLVYKGHKSMGLLLKVVLIWRLTGR